MIKIDISVGDYLDRLSILKIKKEKGLNVDKEIMCFSNPALNKDDYYLNIIKTINLQLWDLEDKKRKGVKRYSKEESDIAFLITQLNDLRHETKKRIDVYFKSEITEKKSH